VKSQIRTSSPNVAESYPSWPGGNGISSDKVPTELSYELSVQHTGTKGSPTNGNGTPGRNNTPSPPSLNSNTPTNNIRWGFQFKPEEPRLRCLKLFLDRNQTLPRFVSSIDTAAQLKRSGKTVLDAAADYLRKLNEHTLQTLTRRHGQSGMRQAKLEYVLTVPAVWSDAAKVATLQAAERAGMGSRYDMQMISEPEAAALYALQTARPAGKAVDVGDNVGTRRSIIFSVQSLFRVDIVLDISRSMITALS